MVVDNSFAAAAASFLPPAARLRHVHTAAPRRKLLKTTQPSPVVVPPSIPRLLGMFVVSGGGMVGGLLVILGPGPLWGTAAAVAHVLLGKCRVSLAGSASLDVGRIWKRRFAAECRSFRAQ